MTNKFLSIIAILGLLLIKPAMAEDYVVGAHMPLTGNLARAGQSFTEGLRVAEYLHNQNSPIKVKLVIIDDESSPAKAITAVEKLASDGATAIIGGYGSNIVAPASEASERHGLVYMTAGAVSEELTKKGLKTFFRVNNNDGYAKAVNTLLDEIDAKNVAILVNTRSDGPTALSKAVIEHLKEKNIKYSEHPFDASTSNFQPLLNKIRVQDKPDVLLMSVYENDYIGILRAGKLMKPDVKAVIGTWSLATAQMQNEFPELVDKVIGTAVISYPVAFNDKEGNMVQDAYKTLYNKDVDYMAVYGYVEAKVIFDAIERLAQKGDYNKTALPEEIRSVEVDSLIGPIKFDETGENVNFALPMAQHQGKEIPIVSPKDKAIKPLILPARPW